MTQPRAILFVFPGQGSQYPGIGSDLCDRFEVVRRVYERAADTLHYDIAELSFRDTAGKIHQTMHTQPVLLTHSIACLEAFRQLTDGAVKPAMAAGHSLGEYSALVAAGAMELAEALKLVQRRGELMGTLGEGEMEALPLEPAEAEALAQKHHCAVAACNLPDQTVVGGRPEDLDRLVAEFAENHPRKRSARLQTEGAFHTFYMVTAALRFREVLDQARIGLPAIPVLSNFSGGFHDGDADSIRSRLFFQLFHPVRWHQNLVAAADAGVDAIVEFGGGIGKGETPAEKRPNLEGIVKKTFRGQEPTPAYYAVINSESLDATVTALTLC